MTGKEGTESPHQHSFLLICTIRSEQHGSAQRWRCDIITPQEEDDFTPREEVTEVNILRAVMVNPSISAAINTHRESDNYILNENLCLTDLLDMLLLLCL